MLHPDASVVAAAVVAPPANCRWYGELREICENMSVSGAIKEEAYSYFRRVLKMLNINPKMAKVWRTRNILAYALYHVLNVSSGGRAPAEVTMYVKLSKKTVFERIRSDIARASSATAVNQHDCVYDQVKIVERYCAMLCLPRHETVKICSFVEEVNNRLFMQDRTDQTVCAVCILHCCKSNLLSELEQSSRRVVLITLKEISRVCQVSANNVALTRRAHLAQLNEVLHFLLKKKSCSQESSA